MKKGFTQHQIFSEKKFGAGFTLIELLVVIAIIGILAAVVLDSVNQAKTKAKLAAFKSEITSLRTGLINQCDTEEIDSTYLGKGSTHDVITPPTQTLDGTALAGFQSCGAGGSGVTNRFTIDVIASNGISCTADMSEVGSAFSGKDC